MPVGIRPSLTFRPRAGDLPHAHKMREYRPTATPLLTEAAGPVDVGGRRPHVDRVAHL